MTAVVDMESLCGRWLGEVTPAYGSGISRGTVTCLWLKFSLQFPDLWRQVWSVLYMCCGKCLQRQCDSGIEQAAFFGFMVCVFCGVFSHIDAHRPLMPSRGDNAIEAYFDLPVYVLTICDPLSRNQCWLVLGYFEIYTVLKTADSADYFGV